jgi:hypothetical protein
MFEAQSQVEDETLYDIVVDGVRYERGLSYADAIQLAERIGGVPAECLAF